MKPVENKVDEVAARYLAIVESSQDAIIGKDLHGIVTSWNPAAEKIFGYAASEMIGHTINRLIPPERQGEEEKILAQIQRGECVPHFETVRVGKDGNTLDISVTVSPIKDAGGRIVGASKLARDITERKRMEANLHSAAQFPDENPYPVMRIDGEGTVLYANRACATWLADCPCKAGQPAPRVFAQAAVTALTSRAVYETEVETGGRTFLFLCAPIPDAGYVNLYLCDITERKQAEIALRESEVRFRTICETSPLGIIFTDLNSDTFYANEAQQRICGLSAKEQAGHGWQAAIHPEDRERVIREWQRIGRTDQPFCSERRYRHKDGKILWASLTAAPIRDNAGVHGYVGMVEDITERKQAEERIRILNQELESRVIQRTSELRTAVDALETEITERLRLEREILEISEREKARVGQDLHDGLCQTLAGIGCLARALQRNLDEEKLSSDAVSAKAESIVNLLKEATNEARGLAAGMYPVNIEEYGLAPGLEKLAADTAQRFHIACKFECAAPVVLADNRAAAHLYRITQEAVNNAIRHGKAESVVISLAAAGERITLKIEDNGKGLLKDMAPTGMGLKTMTYRARSIGGSLDIRQRTDCGIAIICSFPNQQGPET